MDSRIELFLSKCTMRDGASHEKLEQMQLALRIRLPSDYLELLSLTNGTEGFIGDNYVILYAVDDVHTCGVRVYMPCYVFIGSDGGGEGYAYDTRSPDMPIVNVPFIGIDEPPRMMGRTIIEFLERLHDRPLFE